MQEDVVEADFLEFYKSPYKNKQNNWIEKKMCGQYLQ